MESQKYSNEPDHHKRYRNAWNLYTDPDTPKESLIQLQKEMDSAQNDFEWDEFQKFKKTLPEFENHWDNLKKDMLSRMPENYFG